MSWLTKKIRGYAGRKSKEYSRKNLNQFIENAARGATRSSGRNLNIGSGGQIEGILRKQEFDLVSVDIDPKRQPDVVMDVRDLSFGNEVFDRVFMFEVLEHVPEPHVAIAEIHRVLKPGGKVYVSTPFVFGIHDEPHDYFRYTKFGLKFLFQDFDEIEVRERNSYYETICVLMLRLTMSEDKASRNFGILSALLLGFFHPIVFLFSKVIKNNKATTGYTLKAKKR